MKDSIKNVLAWIPNYGKWKKPIGVGLILFFAIIQMWIFYIRYDPRSDWTLTFFAAANDLFINNIYDSEIYSFFYPVWVLLPVFPFSFLPVHLSNTFISVLCLAIVSYIAYKRGAKPFALALYIIMPQIQFMAGNGDIVDVITSVGFILPPQIGLFFVLAKPQTGFAVALFWLAEAWQNGKFKEVFRVFAPVTLAYILMLIMFSPNMIHTLLVAPKIIDAPWDANIWPYGVIIGIALMGVAVRKHDLGVAILASPCFFPYIGFYSWPIVLLGFLPNNVEFIAAILVMCIISLITGQY